MPKHFDMEIDQSFHSPSFVFVRFSINRSEEKDSERERERERESEREEREREWCVFENGQGVLAGCKIILPPHCLSILLKQKGFISTKTNRAEIHQTQLPKFSSSST